MREVEDDMWTQDADAFVISTNGTVTSKGRCVMGKGCAREARDLFLGIDLTLGNKILSRGNKVHLISLNPDIMSFPVKHNWWEKADPNLIRTSLFQLLDLVNRMEYPSIAMPRVGCGNGGLKWEEIREILAPHLDDRFIVCHLKGL